MKETVLTAHLQTTLYTPEERHQLKFAPLDVSTYSKYTNMVSDSRFLMWLRRLVVSTLQTQVDWWLVGAAELTPMIHQIVDFAKMIPGFMNAPQDDQILLLKGGKRYLDLALSTVRPTAYFF